MKMKLVAPFEHCLTKLCMADARITCKKGIKARIHITLAFTVNASGEKEVPIVIGKLASLWRLKGIGDKTALLYPLIL